MSISLRINDSDKELFKAYAKAHGLTLTDFIKETVLERIEDDYDLQELREALKEPNPVYYTSDEVKKELGF